MDLRVLRYLIAIVNAGSMTRAAHHIRVAQPSLSRQIRALEHRLGFALFDRASGQLRLTAAGARFASLAHDLLARADSAELLARALASGHAPELTVAAPPTTITEMLAPFLATDTAHGPLLRLRAVTPTEAHSQLHHGADLVITTAPAHAALAWHELSRAPVWAYPPPEHPWTKREELAIDELVHETLILLTPDQNVRTTLDQAVATAGASYRSFIECDWGIVAQAHAAAGRGIAIVSELPRYGLRPIPITAVGRLRIHIHAAWLPDHYAAETISLLATRIQAHATAQIERLRTPAHHDSS